MNQHDHCESTGDNCIQIVPIFNNLTEAEMLEIANITSASTLDKGSYVYMAGDQGGKLFVLHTGRVKISRINAAGKQQVIRIVEAGEFLGELSLFSLSPLSDNAEVIEKSTMCMIDGQKLKELMSKYPSIAFKVMEVLSQRLEKAENLIENINLNTVEQRLAQALLDLAQGRKTIVLNMTKGDLASQLGMSQETLSRKLANFQEEGLILMEGQRRIKLLKPDLLSLLIDNE